MDSIKGVGWFTLELYSLERLNIKMEDEWHQVSSVYKKKNGSWEEQTALSPLFDANANYIKSN